MQRAQPAPNVLALHRKEPGFVIVTADSLVHRTAGSPGISLLDVSSQEAMISEPYNTSPDTVAVQRKPVSGKDA